MAWEDRNGKRYYYAKEWNGGRVRSRYLGAGPVAEGIATLTQIDQERRNFERQAWQAEKAAVEEVDALLDQAGALIEAITIAALVITGHHQLKRQWRKSRADD